MMMIFAILSFGIISVLTQFYVHSYVMVWFASDTEGWRGDIGGDDGEITALNAMFITWGGMGSFFRLGGPFMIGGAGVLSYQAQQHDLISTELVWAAWFGIAFLVFVRNLRLLVPACRATRMEILKDMELQGVR